MRPRGRVAHRHHPPPRPSRSERPHLQYAREPDRSGRRTKRLGTPPSVERDIGEHGLAHLHDLHRKRRAGQHLRGAASHHLKRRSPVCGEQQQVVRPPQVVSEDGRRAVDARRRRMPPTIPRDRSWLAVAKRSGCRPWKNSGRSHRRRRPRRHDLAVINAPSTSRPFGRTT